MEKKLKNLKNELYFYQNGKKKIVNPADVSTYPPGLRGNISGLRGDIFSGLHGDIFPGLHGNISGLRGDISPGLHGNIFCGLHGNISGLWGNCTDITGDIDECDISDAERAEGVDIQDLIG